MLAKLSYSSILKNQFPQNRIFMMISKQDVIRELWTRWISDIRLDGKEAYRELKKYGNGHVVFEKGAEYGEIHYDKHNATNIPVGTINHLAYHVHKKTGVSEGALRLLGWAGLAYLLYRALK